MPKAELKELRSQIQSLQKEIEKGEANRVEAVDALKSSERAISEANRLIDSLSTEHVQARQELQRLKNDLAARRRETLDRQQQLGKLVAAHYRAGQPDAVKLALSGQDPALAERELTYYRYIAQAETKLIAALRLQMSELNALLEQAAAKERELQRIETDKRAQKTTLEQQKVERAAVLAKVSGEIKSRRQAVDKLKQDEQRLTQLITRLTRLAEERERAARIRAAKLAAEQAKAKARAERAAKASKSEVAKNATKSELADSKPAESTVIARNDVVPEPVAGDSFVALKGRLRLPARGDVLHRFGSPRAEGGSNWRGVFIRTSPGEAVHAIAAGQVVFADWLRGFGNLLIIDHGGGYLSLYGYNESLLKRVGDRVKAGDVVTRAGNTGGAEETGLYFELRHLGKPLDPAQWTS
ncbi:peptidoglycan DD-metalloendopeptidase family protein [Chitinivorax sp. PXF-14]|uniref:murein hydrolase activator EnvC family protein n=1 Tax=Chitinivorax sp. PXF-14 TaxID=3230488 RepID=UPI003465994E